MVRNWSTMRRGWRSYTCWAWRRDGFRGTQQQSPVPTWDLQSCCRFLAFLLPFWQSFPLPSGKKKKILASFFPWKLCLLSLTFSATPDNFFLLASSAKQREEVGVGLSLILDITGMKIAKFLLFLCFFFPCCAFSSSPLWLLNHKPTWPRQH